MLRVVSLNEKAYHQCGMSPLWHQYQVNTQNYSSLNDCNRRGLRVHNMFQRGLHKYQKLFFHSIQLAHEFCYGHLMEELQLNRA